MIPTYHSRTVTVHPCWTPEPCGTSTALPHSARVRTLSHIKTPEDLWYHNCLYTSPSFPTKMWVFWGQGYYLNILSFPVCLIVLSFIKNSINGGQMSTYADIHCWMSALFPTTFQFSNRGSLPGKHWAETLVHPCGRCYRYHWHRTCTVFAPPPSGPSAYWSIHHPHLAVQLPTNQNENIFGDLPRPRHSCT